MKKVAVIVGSLRKDSLNKKLAENLEGLVEGAEFTYVNVDLPLFNEELEADVPQVVEDARAVVKSADVVLLAAPEYNRSVTGVMKNALDWLSRPYAQGVILGKKVGIVGASYSPVGTAAAQAHLKSIVGYLDMKLMGQPELYVVVSRESVDADGKLIVTDAMKDYAKSFSENI